MQTQSRKLEKHKCFLYSNGLMDHICPCNVIKKNSSNGSYYRNVQWYDRPGKFNGTFVNILILFIY